MQFSECVSLSKIGLTVAALSATVAWSLSGAADQPLKPTADQAQALSQKAYTYGYPLVLLDLTCRVMTATPRVTDTKAPYNQFMHKRSFPDHTFTDVVSPNVDTLYSTACLDLSDEPIILSVPDMGDRYYLMPLLDAWTNVFASPGTRTTGQAAGHFAIVGPGWTGTLPAGVQKIQAPTHLVWVLGRTFTADVEDYDTVRFIQNQYKLTPLSAWGTNYVPPQNVPVDPSVDPMSPPVEQVEKMSAEEFFWRVNALMIGNPPAPADQPLISEVAAMSVRPGEIFAAAGFEAEVWAAVEAGIKDAKQAMKAELASSKGKVVTNGWTYGLNFGSYGTDYVARAGVAFFGLGANLTADAVYPVTSADVTGTPFVGTNNYILHFDKAQLPPVKAFWSLTVYNEKQFLVENPIGRYALGSHSALTYNPDGSLDIYIQNTSPGAGKESNWLPTPAGPFDLVLRLYWPEQTVLDGTYQIPGVQKI